MELFVIDNGKIVMVGENGVTAAEASAGEVSIPIHCFLVKTDKGYVLYDTGCDPNGMTENWPDALRGNPHIASAEQQLPDQLAKCGVDLEDVHCVVMSHLHVDHAGGLKLFKGARVIVGQEELTKTMHAYAEHTLLPFYVASDIQGWLRAEVRWELLEHGGQLSLGEGLTVLNLGPGHAYNMLALLVETKHGNYLLVSDAIYTQAHFEDPELLPGIVYDEAGYKQTVRNIRALAEQWNAQVLYGHDTQQFGSLGKLLRAERDED